MNHDWIEVGNRRWCVTPYREGGCGGFQTKQNGRWMPSVLATCTAEAEKLKPPVQEKLSL